MWYPPFEHQHLINKTKFVRTGKPLMFESWEQMDEYTRNITKQLINRIYGKNKEDMTMNEKRTELFDDFIEGLEKMISIYKEKSQKLDEKERLEGKVRFDEFDYFHIKKLQECLGVDFKYWQIKFMQSEEEEVLDLSRGSGKTYLFVLMCLLGLMDYEDFSDVERHLEKKRNYHPTSNSNLINKFVIFSNNIKLALNDSGFFIQRYKFIPESITFETDGWE